MSVLFDVAMNAEESEAGGERDGGPPFANVHSVPTFSNLSFPLCKGFNLGHT